MKFRKKPVVIDAVQFTGRNHIELSRWSHGHVCRNIDDSKLYINTPEGTMTASIDDWIIRGVNGEYYACKPDIFEKTYEVVE